MYLENEIFSILGNLEGQVGLYFEDIQTGKTIEINSHRPYPAASTIKIPLVLYLFKLAEEGKLDLSSRLPISEENKVGGTGILRELEEGFNPSLLDHATLAIIVSDNISTNHLVDVVGGVEKVTEFCKSLGLNETKFQRKMLDTEAMKSGKDNFTSAADMGKLSSLIAKGEAVSKKASKALVDIMKSQQLRSKLPAKLPAVLSYDPVIKEDKVESNRVIVANKTGDLWKTQNDVGIFILPGNNRYVLSVLTSKLKEDQLGIEAIADVSYAVYKYMAKEYDK